MNGRTIFMLAAVTVSSMLAACGGDDPEPQKSSTLNLNGTYRPTQQGAIGSITFSNNKDYLLVPTGCSGGGCADIGTYRIDAEASSVILENAVTHELRTIKLEEVKTADAAAMLIKSYVGIRGDLINPGQQIIDGYNNRTTNGQSQQNPGGQSQQNPGGQQQLADQVSQLLKTIVEAIMNGQQMKQDEQDKKDEEKKEEEQKKEEEKKKEECKQGVPTQDSTQAEKDAYFARCPNGP